MRAHRFRLVTSAALAASLVRSIAAPGVARCPRLASATLRPRHRALSALAKGGGGGGDDEAGGAAGWEPPPGFAVWSDEEDPRALEAEAARRGQPGAGFEMLGSYGGGPAGRPAGSAPLQAAIEMPRGFCCGCGVRFQANDEAAPGYLPASVLQQRLAPSSEEEQGGVGGGGGAEAEAGAARPPSRPRREAVCQRCHSLRYQNRLPSDGLRVGGGVQVLPAASLSLSLYLSISSLPTLSSTAAPLLSLPLSSSSKPTLSSLPPPSSTAASPRCRAPTTRMRRHTRSCGRRTSAR